MQPRTSPLHFQALGLGHVGHLLGCNRDGTFCKGFHSDIKFERTQTIMEGNDHCDFCDEINHEDELVHPID